MMSATNYATVMSVEDQHSLLIQLKLCNVIVGGKTGDRGPRALDWNCVCRS